jgi:hypothetical protein
MRGQLLIGRRFDTRRGAVDWAERERRGLFGLPEAPKYGFPIGLGTFAVVAAVVIALVVIAPWVGFAHE